MDQPAQPELTERDIEFECSRCGNVLVVDRDGEGLELDCPHCAGRIRVPPYRGDPRLLRAQAKAIESTPPVPKPPVPKPVVPEPVVPEPAPVAPAPEPAPVAPAPEPAVVAPPAEPVARRREYDFSSLSDEVVRKREAELRHLLKENQSQRVEIQGYLNQATITLHRNQLKLRKLIERQLDFDAEMSAILRRLSPTSPAADSAAGISAPGTIKSA